MTDEPCRYCSKLVSDEETVKVYSYWGAVECIAHKACAKEGRAGEAYECQVIDADCNDCKHFHRGSRMLHHGSTVKAEKGSYTPIYVQKDAFHGHCLKFDRPTRAFVNFASGHTCFEHRKDQ